MDPVEVTQLEKVNVIGAYPVNAEVHLLEIIVNVSPANFSVDDFAQESPGELRENWQAAYDEHYLDERGELIIGDFSVLPDTDAGVTRLAFFMYFLDFDAPLITPFGEVKLPSPTPMPSRLSRIIEFEPSD